MEKAKNSIGDSACSVDADGNVSNAWLHDEMLKDFDDREFRMQTRQWLIDSGMAVKDVDGLIDPKECPTNSKFALFDTPATGEDILKKLGIVPKK